MADAALGVACFPQARPAKLIALRRPGDEREAGMRGAAWALVSAFALDQTRRALSAETIRVREVVLGAFSDHVQGRLLEATKADVNAWLDSLELVARSRSKYLSHLHAFYSWAICEEFTENDPTAAIPRPKLPRLLPRPINHSDLVMALQLAPAKIRAMLSLACYEGFRCMEIADFQVEWLLDTADIPAIIVAGKGGRDRMVPMATDTEKALLDYGLPRRGHVFLSKHRRPYLPGTVSTMLSRYLRDHGIDATAHQLRHWFGTEVYRRSKNLLLTQQLMGHSSSATTEGYVKLSPNGADADVVRQLSVRPFLASDKRSSQFDHSESGQHPQGQQPTDSHAQ